MNHKASSAKDLHVPLDDAVIQAALRDHVNRIEGAVEEKLRTLRKEYDGELARYVEGLKAQVDVLEKRLLEATDQVAELESELEKLRVAPAEAVEVHNDESADAARTDDTG